MHLRRLLPPVLLLGLVTAMAPMATASAHSGATAAATKIVVVKPVDTAGHPAIGFHASLEADDVVDCSGADPSPGAVSPNIEECSPSASYAIACWKTATPTHHVYCMRNVRSHALVIIKRSGKFASTPIAKKKSRAPLLLILGDGSKCNLRDGGTGAILNGHPNDFVTYYCNKHGAVWANGSQAHYGINESSSAWTVQTASAAGTGSLTTRHVKTAYFVGTASV